MNNQDPVRAPFLRVMAPTVADAVRSAGGLVFDRVRLGWRVVVEVPGDDDTRALRVLGVEVGDHTADHPDRPTALAAADTMYAGEVIVSGSAEYLDGDRSVVSYRLSRAAEVFKAHALAAAGVFEPVESTETFWTSCASHVIASDLTDAG